MCALCASFCLIQYVTGTDASKSKKKKKKKNKILITKQHLNRLSINSFESEKNMQNHEYTRSPKYLPM